VSTRGGPVFTFSLPWGRLAPLPPASYATGYSQCPKAETDHPTAMHNISATTWVVANVWQAIFPWN